MAKYSKEQRDRAVDLYVRYERCAADVIHELGYPSRGMLPVWYRERLEEECAAMEHYLGHGRRLKRTMRALGYPKSHELLTAWIDELAPGRRKPGQRPGSRGTEAEGGGRGRVRTAEITRGGRRTGRGGVRRRETGNGRCSPDPRRRT